MPPGVSSYVFRIVADGKNYGFSGTGRCALRTSGKDPLRKIYLFTKTTDFNECFCGYFLVIGIYKNIQMSCVML